MADFKKLVPFIQKWEGGFANVRDDRGGATNKGITLTTFRNFYGKSKTVDDLKKMSEEQWLYIFKKGYWDKWQADKIVNQSIANILVDWLWMSGPWSITKVQGLIGVTPDCIVGNKTLASINGASPLTLFTCIKQARVYFFNSIVENNPSQKKFLNGWLKRINDFKFSDNEN